MNLAKNVNVNETKNIIQKCDIIMIHPGMSIG
jgi:hypothetical protein